MRLLVKKAAANHLRKELCRAGTREIGGLLLGERLDRDWFGVVDVTVQRSGGTACTFVREPSAHVARLDAFFAETGGDYKRFNCLGEWHSHPTFEPIPSATDVGTMQSMVENPNVGASFLVLVVCRLDPIRPGELELSATAFRSGADPQAVQVSFESGSHSPRIWRRICDFLGL